MQEDKQTEYYDANTGEVLNHKGQRLDSEGRETPDPRPMAPPLGYMEQPPLHELIRQMIRSEQLRLEAQQNDLGTFEEEDDFDVGEDYDPTSPYEEVFDPEPEPAPPVSGEGQSPSETLKEEAEPPPAAPTNG